MQVTSLFWDFDGTLFDTYPLMVETFKRALNQLNVDDIEIDEQAIYETMREHSLGTALQRFSAEFGLVKSELADQFRQIEPTLIGEAAPFVGTQQLLERHLKQGGRHFLLTHRDKSAIELLTKYGLWSAFSGAVTKADPYPRKPNPASLSALINDHDVDKAGAVMIGDRILDIEAGHNAGVASALFDPGRLIEVKNCHPEFVVTGMAELAKALFD